MTSLGLRAIESSATQPAVAFACSRPLTLLDYFRTPYEIAAELAGDTVHQIRPAIGGAGLLWPDHAADAPSTGAVLHASEKTIPLFARVIPDRDAEALLWRQGGDWSPALAVTDRDGEHLASIWRDRDGAVFLPFDPDEVIVNYWSERYTTVAQAAASRRGRRVLMRAYYRLRPLLPRLLQIWLRRAFAQIQARSEFPCWPVETALHDFFDLMFELLAEVAGHHVPRIAAWPDGYTWALVSTHDVEQAEGWAALEPVLELERAHGIRSSWNLVPRRYDVEHDRVRELVDDGFEVGVHGLYHDGRDLESLATLQRRLPGMRAAAESWGAVGFRSPATHRHWELMPQLGFDYDSSYPDTDPFEPQGGGCCSWLPFFNQRMVELPLTLAQDHTLFVILRHADETAWIEKTEFLRRQGGMALINTHPDYLLDDSIMRSYGRFLERFAGDETAWRALPGEVSAWWRRRAASRVVSDGEDWRVVGPAAQEARIELFDGRPAGGPTGDLELLARR